MLKKTLHFMLILSMFYISPVYAQTNNDGVEIKTEVVTAGCEGWIARRKWAVTSKVFYDESSPIGITNHKISRIEGAGLDDVTVVQAQSPSIRYNAPHTDFAESFRGLFTYNGGTNGNVVISNPVTIPDVSYCVCGNWYVNREDMIAAGEFPESGSEELFLTLQANHAELPYEPAVYPHKHSFVPTDNLPFGCSLVPEGETNSCFDHPDTGTYVDFMSENVTGWVPDDT